jgi:hypothetical protein
MTRKGGEDFVCSKLCVNEDTAQRKIINDTHVITIKNNSAFCNITPCSPLEVNKRFGGICRLHVQGRRINQARNQA